MDGYLTYKSGGEPAENPYPSYTANWWGWVTGYIDAEHGK